VVDVLIDERTGTIAGYALDVRTGGRGLFGLLRRGGNYWPDYVRADVDLRVGRHIIVAPDHALVQGEKIEPPAAVDPSEDRAGWQIAAPPPALVPPRVVTNRSARPAATARLGATIPIAVNGEKPPEIALSAESA
jgi:hypothetical protein